MFTILKNGLSLLADGDSTIDPLYEAITTIGPYALGLVLALGLIYSIFLGVKMSKAENAEEMNNAKKQLINGIIGFVAIFVLLAILYAIREPLIDWANNG